MDSPLVPESENRLASFNDHRASIVDEVIRRVIDEHLRLAADEVDEALEYVLNEVAFSEIRRLEQGGKENKKKLQRWRDLAQKLGNLPEMQKRKELESIVRYHAQDIAGNFNPRVFRFANDILPPALSFLLNPISGFREGLKALGQMADQIRIEGPMEQIHRCCQRGTLVVTPTHSSNLDSIVLGFALNRAGLPPVTYGAGKNLFSNAFMSYFMENLGAYRVDRRLRFRLYKEVLKEYSTVLLERGFHSLFFPGGTRSRSNLVESKLKLGLLGTTATAMANNYREGGRGKQIYIVPVTINYRLVLEAETLIEDYLADTGKSRYIIEDDEFSRLGRVFDFMRKTLSHEGSAILRFGSPLDPLGNAVDELGDSLDGQGRPVDPASFFQNAAGEVVEDAQRDSVYTRILGKKLAESYRRETVIMNTHLVARATLAVAKKRTGISDILKLMRLSESALAIPKDELCLAINALRRAIEKQAHNGCLDTSMEGLSAEELLEQTLKHLSSYHTRPVLYQSGEHLRVGSMKLLYYYHNRCAHVDFCWEGGR